MCVWEWTRICMICSGSSPNTGWPLTSTSLSPACKRPSTERTWIRHKCVSSSHEMFSEKSVFLTAAVSQSSVYNSGDVDFPCHIVSSDRRSLNAPKKQILIKIYKDSSDTKQTSRSHLMGVTCKRMSFMTDDRAAVCYVKRRKILRKVDDKINV